MSIKLAHLPLMCVVSVLTLAVSSGPASAQQDFPVKPIRLIVAVAPGGATDILARAIGTKLAENLRQQVIVENRPRANHTIGGQVTQKAPPDGYTIQVILEGWVINTSMYAKLPPGA